MIEPSNGAAGEIADTDVEDVPDGTDQTEQKVELRSTRRSWRRGAKSDYEVDPDAEDSARGVGEDGMDEGQAPG
jgi:hypothetical protein